MFFCGVLIFVIFMVDLADVKFPPPKVIGKLLSERYGQHIVEVHRLISVVQDCLSWVRECG